MRRKGDVVWYPSIGIGLTYISAIFLVFLKDPGSLNCKKPVQRMSDFSDSLIESGCTPQSNCCSGLFTMEIAPIADS